MARKTRKSKMMQRAENVTDPIPETGGLPRPAVIGAIAIVLLLLGVTVGVVIDVVMRPAPPATPPATQSQARPKPAAPPVIVNAPETPSIFDEFEGPNRRAPSVSASSTSPVSLYAVSSDVPDDVPVVAIVIDDMGLDRSRAARITALPGPMTLSYLTYADGLTEQAARARDAGHEVMAHVPMEPLGNADPGPGALTSGATPSEIKNRLDAYLSDWSGYVGVNNHMGSKLTADQQAMDVVMSELRDRGLLWLDSRTDSGTVGEAAAAAYGVPHIGRDVFLDNEDDRSAIDAQLQKVEAVARQQGYAVAIGHPRDNTIQALAAWLPALEEKGLALAPVTEVVRRRTQ